ncbi:hypothetical protein D3C81_2051250 [compost metagenome]
MLRLMSSPWNSSHWYSRWALPQCTLGSVPSNCGSKPLGKCSRYCGCPTRHWVLLLSTFITMSVFSSGGKRTRSATSKPSCSRSTRRLVLSMNSSTCGYLSM